MPKLIFYLDGKYAKADLKLLNSFTPGHHHWHGVFETMRVCGGTAESVDAHLSRLLKGLKVLKVKHAYTSNYLKRIIRGVISKNPAINLGRLRLMIFTEDNDVHCTAMVLPYAPPSAKQYQVGLKLTVIKTKRKPSSKYADVKSLDYSIFADAHKHAQASGFDDAVLLNTKGHVFESTRANVFIAHEGNLITPPLSSGCLNGIVRQEVIKRAKLLKISVYEQAITLKMLQRAEHIYLTNSLLGIIPASLR